LYAFQSEIERKGAAPIAVILCPTRELAEQVEWNIFQYGKFLPELTVVGVQGAFKDVSVQVIFVALASLARVALISYSITRLENLLKVWIY